MTKTEPTKENPAFIILNAVQDHERHVGVGTLALILKGSKSKLVFDRKLYNSRFFGSLFYHHVDVIENFTKQLVQQGSPRGCTCVRCNRA